MKTLLSMLIFLGSLSAGAQVSNCFKKTGVVKGQFVVLLNENLSNQDKNATIRYINDLGLSIIDSFSDTYLVNRTALNMLTVADEQRIIKGLNVLVGKQADSISCNSVVHINGN